MTHLPKYVILFFVTVLHLAVFARTPGQFPSPVHIQDRELQFRNFTTDQGLSHSKVNCILQDHDGFLWFGTNEGLSRYDGYSFTVFQQDPGKRGSLSANLVRSMLEDHQGFIWVGTEDGGLNRFNRSDKTFTRFGVHPDGSCTLKGKNINDLVEDSSGCLWVGHENGLDRISRERDRVDHFQPYPEPGEYQTLNEILILHPDHSGMLWAGGSSGGLHAFDPKSGRFTTCRHRRGDRGSISDDDIRSILEDKDHNLWIGTNSGRLNLYDRAAQRFSAWHPGVENPESTTIRALLDDGRGTLWIGNRSGLYRMDKKTRQIIGYAHDPNNPRSLVQNSVQAIFQDAKGDLWIGTRGGVSLLNTNTLPFIHYRADVSNRNCLNSQEVYAILEDRSGDLWIGTESGGLNRLDRQTGIFSYYTNEYGNPHSLSVNNIKALYQDRQGDLWIGTFNGGLNLLRRGSTRFVHYLHDPSDPASLAIDNVLSLLEDEHGNLWIGTYGGGLDRFDRGSKKFVHMLTAHHPAGFAYIHCLLRDRQGRLWMGANQARIGCLDPMRGTFKSYTLKQSDQNIEVKALHEDEKGNLWIGTVGAGLFRFEMASESLELYTAKNGLPSNIIHGILEDGSGMLWLSTSNGLCRFDVVNKRSKCFYKENGLQSNQFNYGSALKTRAGELFFGGINGVSAFYPEAIEDNHYIPPVVVTDFRIFNRPVEINGSHSVLDKDITQTRELALSYKHTVFSFEFAALNFAISEQNQYAYMMEGFDKEWNLVGNRRFATYTNLNPGAYTFRVKAANNDGIWNEHGAAIRITISTPFWQTTWFKIILLVVLIGVIRHYIVYFRQKRDLLKAKSLASLAQLKLLRYQMNPHFLFNTLGSIRSMILISQEQAWDMVSALSDFLRYSLLNFNKAEALLDDEINAVNNYLNIEKVRYRDSLQVSYTIDEAARRLVVPAFICQPLIENAIKYGMQTSPMPLRVNVAILYRDEVLSIDVSNSGRLKESHPEQSRTGDGHGASIVNIRQRLEIMFREEQSFSLYEEAGWVHARIRITAQGLNRAVVEE